MSAFCANESRDDEIARFDPPQGNTYYIEYSEVTSREGEIVLCVLCGKIFFVIR